MSSYVDVEVIFGRAHKEAWFDFNWDKELKFHILMSNVYTSKEY